ncbi:MAG: TetR/AcrR family transcriptional regulator [Chloroflexi bacterium]|nr:TetR/AcrR family transcriptional regulator [Chloroflexota bacterium]
MPDAHDTRSRIRDAALQLFLEQGYHGTSMRQIARRAGVAPAAIYNHLASKEALFVQLLSDLLPHRAMLRAMAEASGGSVEALVGDATRRVAEVLADQDPNLRLMFIELLEFQGRHAGFLAEELLPGALVFMRRLQQADGRLRPYSPMIIARAFFGLLMSYAVTVTFFRQVGMVEFRQDDLTDFGNILLHGILEPAPAGGR